MDPKELYRSQFSDDVPLYHQPFWLDAVTEGNWNVLLIKDGEKVKASMPYAMKKSLGGTEIYMPAFTQFLGPHLNLQSNSYRDRLNEEINLIESLCDQIPNCGAFLQRWHYQCQNWLPFYWKGFQQTTRYTYMIEDLNDQDLLWKGFNENIRRQIRKAQGRFTIEEWQDDPVFLDLLKANFISKKIGLPYKEDILQKLITACRLNQKILLLAAKEENKIAAAVFIAFDRNTAYYIIGGKNPMYGNSGAMSALFFHAFDQLNNKVVKFNFAGSMLAGVEKFFRSFGAVQKPYFEISKFNSLALRAKYAWLQRH